MINIDQIYWEVYEDLESSGTKIVSRWATEELANQNKPKGYFHGVRQNYVSLKIYESAEEYAKDYNENLVASALSKLTREEKIALGLFQNESE